MEIINTSFRSTLSWLVASVFSFFQFFLQSAPGVLGIYWAQDFHLDKVGLGNLSAAFFYSFALMQIPAGILFDYFQPRYILSMAALSLTIGCFLLASTDNYHLALIARLFMGAGSSFGFVGLLQMTAVNFHPKRFAMMVGIAEGFTMLFVMIGIIILSGLVAHYSWRWIILGCGVITGFLGATIFFLVTKNESHDQDRDNLSIKVILIRLKIIFTHRQVILNSLFGFFIFSIVNAFTSLWGISFLTNTHPFDQQTAAKMIAMVFVGIAIGGPLIGWLSKVIDQSRWILLGGAGCATFVMSVIIFFPYSSQILFFILFLLIGIFCTGYLQCFTVIKNSVNPKIRATALAASNMIIMLGAPIQQLLIGWLLQNHFFGLATQVTQNYRLSLSILPIGMFIAFLLAFWIKEPKEIER